MTVETGYFVDGPVEGLSYSTAIQSGTTGADGAFQYNEGEVVSFYITLFAFLYLKGLNW